MHTAKESSKLNPRGLSEHSTPTETQKTLGTRAAPPAQAGGEGPGTGTRRELYERELWFRECTTSENPYRNAGGGGGWGWGGGGGGGGWRGWRGGGGGGVVGVEGWPAAPRTQRNHRAVQFQPDGEQRLPARREAERAERGGWPGQCRPRRFPPD
ncbi:hypothetical protein NHX12_022860 [Muraenolepis orangiensis]|uniref:Uncharacterized protein n=1 Tax=Muraenolepis orangiensis TaxID=630683 RepID=A0A9Q0EP35_9TELE|nr:hypothetical protein NHX12_022860 [Muraenolepis orangiensis]